MNTICYYKLVRDRIPEIIQASGKTCVTEILPGEDYLKMLDAKLDEELAEYHKDQSIEELADLLEVLYAVAVARGYTLEKLEALRAEKAAKRGAFEKRLLLKQVIELSEAVSIAKTICQMKPAIMGKLNRKMFDTYFWLQNNLQKRNVSTDAEYQRKFAGYYRMRYVSSKYRNSFFEVFEETKQQTVPSFRTISEALFKVDRKHEFSFITNQATETFRRLWPSVTTGRYMESIKQPNAHVVCGSVQSVALHLEQFKDNDFDYIIVDEAHHASADTYQKVLSYFKPSFTLGLTATPERTDDNKVILDIFKNTAHKLDTQTKKLSAIFCPILSSVLRICRCSGIPKR